MIKLGEIVKDTVTDFEGMAVARCVYLNGCIRIEVQPKGLDKDGKIVDAVWIDESQLVCKDKTKKFDTVAFGEEEETGGPQSRPSEISHP